MNLHMIKNDNIYRINPFELIILVINSIINW